MCVGSIGSTARGRLYNKITLFFNNITSIVYFCVFFSSSSFSITGKSRVMFGVTTSEGLDCACYPRRAWRSLFSTSDRIKKRFSCDDFIQFRRRACEMWTRFLQCAKSHRQWVLKIDVIERFSCINYHCQRIKESVARDRALESFVI